MKTVRFADFVAEAEHYRDLAEVEVIIVTGDDGAPQFVVMPHALYLQYRKGEREAPRPATEDEIRMLQEGAMPDNGEWPDENEPESRR